MLKKKIAVLGAGLGGLAAAIHLSSKGYDVTLFEKNEDSGGKIGIIQENGFTFDTGPSVITLPFVIDDIFNTLGMDRSKFLEFIKLNPVNRNFFSDGTFIDSFSEKDKMTKELAKLSVGDSKQYSSYINYTKQIYEKANRVFLFEPIHEIAKLIKEHKFPNLLDFRYIDSFRTMNKANSTFFGNDNIRKIFNRYATYNGSSPYKTPATMNIIAYVELILGAYYIKGGIYNLNREITKLAILSGTKIFFNSEITKILSNNDKIKGVEVNGEKYNFDYVISNIDVIETFTKLIDAYPKYTAKLKKIEPSMSGFVMILGVKKSNKKLIHHNVLFSDNYQKEFDDIYNGKISESPTIYIAITSKSDTEHAPEGCENWFILLNMPFLNNNIDWDKQNEYVRNLIIKRLEMNELLNSNDIIYEKTFTPKDLYNKYRSNRGSIYGISSNNRMSAFKRPANRSRIIENLYFAGGSTHPGGGIPLVLLSGKNCADLIQYYQK